MQILIQNLYKIRDLTNKKVYFYTAASDDALRKELAFHFAKVKVQVYKVGKDRKCIRVPFSTHEHFNEYKLINLGIFYPIIRPIYLIVDTKYNKSHFVACATLEELKTTLSRDFKNTTYQVYGIADGSKEHKIAI